MNIVDMVYYWARATPRRPAVIEAAGTIPYTTLAHAIEASAQYFAANIEEKSKPVAVSVNTGSKMLVALLGLLRAGFDVVLANDAVFKHLSSIGVNTLIFERGGATLTGAVNIPFDDNWLSLGRRAETQTMPLPRKKTDDHNILCFTSGTTGRPKVVVCPQSSWQRRVLFPINSAFSNYERMLIVPGLITSWGLSRAYEALHAGRTICLAPPGKPALWMMNTYDVDTILASPQQALELAEIQEKVTRYPLSALKSFQVGASTMSPTSVLRVKKNLCRNVIMIYGSTEAGVVAVAPYDMIAEISGAVGYVVAGVDVEIVDAADRVLPIGKEGFVRVRSQVFAENMAAGNSSDKWFYPGDLGSLTEDNMLCITGRNSDVVNRGGEKLSIVDIENFLLTCSGVNDAGVCTVVGLAGYSEVWVGLVLEPSADMAALRHTIESNVHYKNNIDRIFVVESIPRGTLGKVQREELKSMLQAIGEDNDSIN
jgi:acyl-coenzyme A synthetase/AMP-(fatty) acid ligase